MNRAEAVTTAMKIKEECTAADNNCNGCIYRDIYDECPLVGNPQNWELETEE